MLLARLGLVPKIKKSHWCSPGGAVCDCSCTTSEQPDRLVVNYAHCATEGPYSISHHQNYQISIFALGGGSERLKSRLAIS